MMPQVTTARVIDCQPINNHILKVLLQPTIYGAYQAGQYLQIALPHEQAMLPFSIANAPSEEQVYELHIRHTKDNATHQLLRSTLQIGHQINIQIPFGDCHVAHLSADRPLLLIAAGTGIAPIKAIIEHYMKQQPNRQIELIWGVHSLQDSYLTSELATWQKQNTLFKYHIHIAQRDKKSFDQFVLGHLKPSLATWQIVMSGPFNLIYFLRDHWVKQGLSTNHLFSDAFDFEHLKKG